jgi:hypothetical protein
VGVGNALGYVVRRNEVNMENWKLYKHTTPLGIAFYIDLGHEVRGNRWWWEEGDDNFWYMCGNTMPIYPHPLVLSNRLEYLVLTGRHFKVEEVGMYWSDRKNKEV